MLNNRQYRVMFVCKTNLGSSFLSWFAFPTQETAQQYANKCEDKNWVCIVAKEPKGGVS